MVRILIFVFNISFFIVVSNAQCNCDSIHDLLDRSRICVNYSPFVSYIGPGVVYNPKDTFLLVTDYNFTSCLRICDEHYVYPIYFCCPDIDVSERYYLNGLHISKDHLSGLGFSKSFNKNSKWYRGTYDVLFTEKDSTRCVSTINFYLTTTIPIYLNGKIVPINDCEVITGSITPEQINFIQRTHKKIGVQNRDRIDIITK